MKDDKMKTARRQWQGMNIEYKINKMHDLQPTMMVTGAANPLGMGSCDTNRPVPVDAAGGGPLDGGRCGPGESARDDDDDADGADDAEADEKELERAPLDPVEVEFVDESRDEAVLGRMAGDEAVDDLPDGSDTMICNGSRSPLHQHNTSNKNKSKQKQPI